MPVRSECINRPKVPFVRQRSPCHDDRWSDCCCRVRGGRAVAILWRYNVVDFVG